LLRQLLSRRAAARPASLHLLFSRRIWAGRAGNRGGDRRARLRLRRVPGGNPARRAQRGPGRPGRGGHRARLCAFRHLAAHSAAAGSAHFRAAADQRVHPAPQSLLARLGGRHCRTDPRQHEHRVDDLSAARGLSHRRADLSGDQSLSRRIRRLRRTAAVGGPVDVSFQVLLHYMPSLLSGFGVTVLCWSAGSIIGLAVGFAVTLLNRLKIPPLHWLLRAYAEIMRGTPFLVQLFLLYAGGPFIGLRLSATAAGILGLGLYSSAYFAEIFRGGFAAVPQGQIEAAMSVGMKPSDILFRIRAPIALTATIPSIVNMLVILSKETVVLSIITVPELMYQMQTMAAETFTAFDAIFAMAVFYWILVEAVSRIGRRLEIRVTA